MSNQQQQMSAQRTRFFPRPFRVDGARDDRSSTAGVSRHFSEESDDELAGRREGSSCRPSSRPPLFSSQLPPPSDQQRYNKDGTTNVEWARYQNTLRLKSKWDSIYERYKDAHLTEQDEIHYERTSQESSASSDSDEPPSHSREFKIVRDCGTLRNLAGTLQFGSFIKEEELHPLEAVDLSDAEDVGAPSTALDGKTMPSSSFFKETSSISPDDEEGADDAFSEVEVGSDEDEIGGWGDTGFTRSQYPEFNQGAARSGSASKNESEEQEADIRLAGQHKHDPDLEEFLLAEARRRRFCAPSTGDSEASDTEDFNYQDIASDPPSDPSTAYDLMEEQQYSSSDDDLDLLHSPRKSRPAVPRPARPPSDVAPQMPLPTTGQAQTKELLLVPVRNLASVSGSGASRLQFLPSFEEARRSKRTGVDAILARWTSEQETHLARLEEDDPFVDEEGMMGDPIIINIYVSVPLPSTSFARRPFAIVIAVPIDSPALPYPIPASPPLSGTGFNANVLSAGYQIELAGGSHHNAKAWAFQSPLWQEMRREGLPLQGFCIAAWIPSTENAKDTIAGLRNAGIEHVAFKPASANAIQQRRPEWPWYRQNTSPWLNFLFVLVRYPSTKSGEELTSLKDCITRMPEGQKGIYYLTGESLDSIRSSLFLERLKKKGYEILLMADLIDEYAATQLKEFEGQKLIRVSKEGLELDDDLSDDEKKSFEELTMTVKDIFGEKVEKGILSNRILVTVQFVNPHNAIVKELAFKVAQDKNDPIVRDLVHLLFEASLLTSGFNLDKPSDFAGRLYKLISLGLSIDDPGAEDDAGAKDSKDDATAGEGIGESQMESID
ncbi:unnamed protein product [Tilletia controversa]|nr:unnamed protein product [Tilletia controversa]